MEEAMEVETLHAQIEELRERLENLGIVGSPRGQSKDVSLVAGIKEWTGESKGRPVQEFLTQIETLAKVSGWTSQDKALIVKAKLQGLALQFMHGREELGRDGCSYETLKQALVERFSDKLPDQYYYTKLQEAKTNHWPVRFRASEKTPKCGSWLHLSIVGWSGKSPVY
jgi:predicted mannosyl-3-phosphoglycerate phosphatase (HAD superfamily)